MTPLQRLEVLEMSAYARLRSVRRHQIVDYKLEKKIANELEHIRELKKLFSPAMSGGMEGVS